MSKIRELLQGKKTYILAALAVIGIWVDYFFQLVLSELCALTPSGDVCKPDLSAAVQMTWAAFTASSIRAAISK